MRLLHDALFFPARLFKLLHAIIKFLLESVGRSFSRTPCRFRDKLLAGCRRVERCGFLNRSLRFRFVLLPLPELRRGIHRCEGEQNQKSESQIHNPLTDCLVKNCFSPAYFVDKSAKIRVRVAKRVLSSLFCRRSFSDRVV